MDRSDGGRIVNATHPQVPAIDAAAAELLAATADVDLLDVREVSEWIHGHIADTINIPLGQLALHVSELSRERRIVCICRSGNRSAIATALLCDAGYDAVNLSGGTAGWASSGRPLVDRTGSPGVVV